MLKNVALIIMISKTIISIPSIIFTTYLFIMNLPINPLLLFELPFDTSGIFGILHLILFILAVYDIVRSDKPISKKILWMLLVFILPCVGLIVYYFIGRE